MGKKLAFLSCLALLLGLVAPSVGRGATFDIKLAASTDDMEEYVATGGMSSTSSDLEMPYEDSVTASKEQLVGVRYFLAVPKGVKISKAYVEFTVDELTLGTKPVNLLIQGQLVANAPAFTSTAFNISSRTVRTKAQVQWSVENWTTVGQKSQTPDLTAILQELTTQDGWASGNAIALIITDDKSNPSTGLRCADAMEDQANNAGTAPVLHVEFFSPEAKNPNPANGAQEVGSPLFQWTAGDGTVTHNVYLGTSATLGAADLVGPAMPVPMYYYLAGLTPGVTYYWRVDEIAADGTVTTGPVWSFTAIHMAAYLPSPADGGVWQRNDTTISWKAGSGAVSHTVYGGADKAAVTAGAPSVLLGTQAQTSFTLGKLAPLTVYYWRVDELGATGAAVPGPVWSFNVVGANTGSWRTAAAATGPGYLATYVADGVYDIGTFGGEMTYEFIVRGNPDEKEASQCLIGRRDFGTTQMGLKYEQWNNTGTYGATVFGVADYDFKVPNAPGEYTHLVFVSSTAAKKTDLYVNGVLKGSVATDITLSGQVGIGYGAQNRPPAAPYFDNFDGSIFGVAIYDQALSVTEIAANSATFLLGGPEAVTLDIKLAASTDDTEEYVGTGAMSPTSSDLEMPYEDSVTASKEQLVGVRYLLAVPKGAQITKAYVEFTCDELTLGTKPVNLLIQGQLVANAPAFTSTAKDISSRTVRTKAQVQWAVENWTTVGQKSQTADLAAIVQELVSQDGWVSGNAIALILSDDKTNPSTGLRVADAMEDQNSGAGTAPVLHLEILIPWAQ